MSSTYPDQSTILDGNSKSLSVSFEDITNFNSFIESLVNLLNEAALVMNQVKERSGISQGCSSPVRMLDEEQKQKMNDILNSLSEQFSLEVTQTTNTSLCPCDPCADPSVSQTLTPTSFNSTARSGDGGSKRAGTPIPGGSPATRVASPDRFFIPVSQSSPIRHSPTRYSPNPRAVPPYSSSALSYSMGPSRGGRSGGSWGTCPPDCSS